LEKAACNMHKSVWKVWSVGPSFILLIGALSASVAFADLPKDASKSAVSEPAVSNSKSAFSDSFADLVKQSDAPQDLHASSTAPSTSPSPSTSPAPHYGKPLADSLNDEAAATAEQPGSATLAPFKRAGGAFAPLHGMMLPRPINLPANSSPSLKQAATLISNLSVVSPNLIRGAQPTSAALGLLKFAGVKTVINLRNEEVLVAREAQDAKRAGLNYVNIPMTLFGSPTRQQFQRFLDTVDMAGPVFVHCQLGEDRTGTMVAIYRMSKEGWDANRAYQEMTAMGFKSYLGSLSGAVYDYSASLGRPARRPMPDLGGFTSILKH
jgi:protein tyrosine phosphatase (PTP) superfamily phosphohydrolase (DUF442 family)